MTVADTSTLTTGEITGLKDIVGMTELNDVGYAITVINGTTFSLTNIDSTGYTAYSSGGSVTPNARFGTIEPYGDILFSQWIATNENDEAIDKLQAKLESLIEVYWVRHDTSFTSDNEFLTSDLDNITCDMTP